MSISLERTRIDPEDPQFQQMLANLQCNILKSHGRDCAVHIFLKFTAPPDEVKAWIRNFSETHVTSALAQYQQSQNRRETHKSGGLVGSVLLSAEGYQYLEFDVDRFKDNDETFREGMKHKDFDPLGRILDRNNKDPEPAEWEAGFQGVIHAMILLARDTHDSLERDADAVKADVAKVATVLTAEWGEAVRNDTIQANGKGQAIEHFGYVDGRSIPVFLKADIENEEDKGTNQWYPAANLSLVLIPDPHTDVEDSFGSYFVFRKLEQNVEGFNSGVADLASELGIDRDLAGAFCVGRFRDGTPVTLRGSAGAKGADNAVNNFEYKSADASGDRCPHHAHIRKVNPRGTTPFTSSESERSRRIVRRGIPYGKANSQQPPREGVGLLFMCYQSDINLQFEFIQRTWSDNPNFPRRLVLPDTGDDPLIGQDTDRSASQNWPTGWDSSDRKRANFGGYITLKGGEYFFAPSISFLKAI